MSTARLIIADSEHSADLYYATRFLAPDPFILVQMNGRRTLLMSDLELDRARSQAKVEEVVSLSVLTEQAKRCGIAQPGLLDILDTFLKERGVTALEVPQTFSVAHADRLRERGYQLRAVADPFYPERVIKSEQEIAHLTQALRVTEQALERAIDLIHNAEVRDGTLWLGGGGPTGRRAPHPTHLRPEG